MPDNFKQKADAASGSAPQPQDTAPGGRPGGTVKQPRRAYYGTLGAPPDAPPRPAAASPVPPDYSTTSSGMPAGADTAAEAGPGYAPPEPWPGAGAEVGPSAAGHIPAEEKPAALSDAAARAVDEGAQAIPPSGVSALEEDQPALLAPVERDDQLARLEYVCHWLREARLPLCPVNGVLTLLPLNTIQAGPRENVELQRAVKADLATIQHQLKLRFPSTALVVGLQEDRGFEELVRRVGPQRAGSQRFGHRFDVRMAASPGELASLCARITGVFEDWVYTIYRERGSTARPGNSHLFGLLCKVRTQLQGRLLRVLAGGFGHDPQQEPDEEPIAFSGCYFAATGRPEDRRAFIQGVFDKLIEEQDQVEWTGRALAEDRRFRLIGWLGLAVAAIFGLWLLIGVVSQTQ
jgi:hypothetical protein